MTKSGLALIVATALIFAMSIADQIENRVSGKVAQTLAKKGIKSFVHIFACRA